jgi:hypothetical protein
VETLEKAGIKVSFYESLGTAHEWLTWRRDFHQFAPLLLRWSVGSFDYSIVVGGVLAFNVENV